VSTVTTRKADGSEGTSVTLDDKIFGITPNVACLHQVVVAQLAARRAGTQSTKTRSEVRGGGAKPFRQKGGGRSRQGTTRAPQWSGGGIALGPKPRKYTQKTPKKMIALALRSALSDRAAENRVVVMDGDWGFDKPSTKQAAKALSALDLEGRVLMVVNYDDELGIKSFRNLPQVQLILAQELNAYDVLCNDWIVFTEGTVPGLGEKVAGDASVGQEDLKAADAPRDADDAAATDDKQEVGEAGDESGEES